MFGRVAYDLPSQLCGRTVRFCDKTALVEGNIRRVSLSAMKQIFTTLVHVSISCSGAAATPAAEVADNLVTAVCDAHSVSIEFYSPAGKEDTRLGDPSWIERLAAALAVVFYES